MCLVPEYRASNYPRSWTLYCSLSTQWAYFRLVAVSISKTIYPESLEAWTTKCSARGTCYVCYNTTNGEPSAQSPNSPRRRSLHVEDYESHPCWAAILLGLLIRASLGCGRFLDGVCPFLAVCRRCQRIVVDCGSCLD